jgi:hypothetical protein
LSHEIDPADLYMRLGELSGSIKALTSLVQDKRADIVTLTERVNAVEMRVAGGVALAVALSLLLPTSITVFASHSAADTKAESVKENEARIQNLEALIKRYGAGTK